MVGYGVSIFLITIGAILNFAVKAPDLQGVDLNTMGLILMIVGGATLVLQIVQEMSRSRGSGRDRSFDREGPPRV